MKILFIDTCHPSLEEGLINLGYQTSTDNQSSKEEIMSKMSNYQGFVIRSRFKIDKNFLDSCKNLKFIVRFGAGLENIDVDYAEALGIELIAAPEGNANAVGEHALGMLLSLMRNLNRADKEVRKGIWLREENRGWELSHKTVGIIGYGNMGKAFARVLRGFECNVVFYDIKNDVEDQNAVAVSLDKLLKKSDIISIHTPLTDLTKGMLNDEFFAKIKKKAIIINTARGPIMNTEALVNAIEDNKIAGACLDVLEYEKTSFENLFLDGNLPNAFKYLIDSEKVVLSPHIAGWTNESNLKMSEVVISKLKNKFQ
jgi:D-3-phosphoglycerate dehydrogenase / 2-oxoglutarate reductase